MKSLTVWRGHSTRPSLSAGTARKASGHLSGRRPLHLANARPFGRLKAPLGLSLLRCAAQTRSHPKPCLERTRRNCVNLTQFLPLQRETERSRWGTPCCTYCYRMWIFQGASAGAHPIFVSSWLGVRQNAFTGSFSPWLHRGWFCAVPPSGRTIPPLQGRREQRRHWFWYPVRRSFPCPQRTA